MLTRAAGIPPKNAAVARRSSAKASAADATCASTLAPWNHAGSSVPVAIGSPAAHRERAARPAQTE